MEGFVKGDIVVIRFPFSDSTTSKKRPALVTANTYDNNLLLAQITSRARPDPDALPLTKQSYRVGGLKHDSFIRPTILFSMHKSRIQYKVGTLKETVIKTVEKKYCDIFTR